MKTATKKAPTITVAMAAEPKPRVTPQALCAMAKKFNALDKEIKRLKRLIDPIDERLKAVLLVGETRCGKWCIVKTHYNAASIPAHTRNPYDTIKVEAA